MYIATVINKQSCRRLLEIWQWGHSPLYPASSTHWDYFKDFLEYHTRSKLLRKIVNVIFQKICLARWKQCKSITESDFTWHCIAVVGTCRDIHDCDNIRLGLDFKPKSKIFSIFIVFDAELIFTFCYMTNTTA